MRRILAAASLALAVTFTGCDVQPTVPDMDLRPAYAKGGKKGSTTTTTTSHVVQFSGDILSAPITDVMLDPSNPLANVAIPVTPINLPDVVELLGCGLAEGGNWTPYAGDWTGYLALTSDATTATLNFTAYAADGTPFWLSVSGATTTEKVGSSTVLTFTDLNAFAKLDQDPLVVIFPCTSFQITATPQ